MPQIYPECINIFKLSTIVSENVIKFNTEAVKKILVWELSICYGYVQCLLYINDTLN